MNSLSPNRIQSALSSFLGISQSFELVRMGGGHFVAYWTWALARFGITLFLFTDASFRETEYEFGVAWAWRTARREHRKKLIR